MDPPDNTTVDDPPENGPSIENNADNDVEDLSKQLQRLSAENTELKDQKGVYETKLIQLQKSCSEYKAKADRCNTQIESMKRELQSMVMNYAKSEKDLLNLRKHFADVDRKYKELLKEKDTLQAKLKELTDEKKQLLTSVERNVLEAANLKRDNELAKTKLAQANVQIEQLQLTVAEVNLKYQSTQSVLNQIETSLGTLDDTCVESQPQLSLFDEPEKEENDGQDTQSKPDWIQKYVKCIQKNEKLGQQISELEEEKVKLLANVKNLTERLESSDQQIKEFEHQQELIEALKAELIGKQKNIADIKTQFDRINEINRELVNDVESSKHKEGELLEYTERLTAKMVSLQSECNTLGESLKVKEIQCDGYKADLERLQKTNDRLKAELDERVNREQFEGKELNAKLISKEEECTLLKNKIEEVHNEIKIVQRKHVASLKELNKELLVLKRKNQELETKLKKSKNEASTKEDKEAVKSFSALSSRTNSSNSLNDASQSSNCVVAVGSSDNDQPASNSSSPPSSTSNELLTSLNDIDKNMLIERILRLQRTLIKRNEKVDFLEEHNQQLMDEVKKKNKLLQVYILKEETGALATETMDRNKVTRPLLFTLLNRN